MCSVLPTFGSYLEDTGLALAKQSPHGVTLLRKQPEPLRSGL